MCPQDVEREIIRPPDHQEQTDAIWVNVPRLGFKTILETGGYETMSGIVWMKCC